MTKSSRMGTGADRVILSIACLQRDERILPCCLRSRKLNRGQSKRQGMGKDRTNTECPAAPLGNTASHFSAPITCTRDGGRSIPPWGGYFLARSRRKEMHEVGSLRTGKLKKASCPFPSLFSSPHQFRRQLPQERQQGLGISLCHFENRPASEK